MKKKTHEEQNTDCGKPGYLRQEPNHTICDYFKTVVDAKNTYITAWFVCVLRDGLETCRLSFFGWNESDSTVTFARGMAARAIQFQCLPDAKLQAP